MMIGILTPLLIVTSPVSPNQWIQEMRQWKLEQNRTSTEELINNTLLEYEEMEHGCDDTTEQEELLQLPSDED